MSRLRLFILLFFVAVSFPLGFVIWHSYLILEQEERGQLQFFSEALFDQMEKELAELVQREELRAVDEYQYFLITPSDNGATGSQVSPLAVSPAQSYILGYLQNNPDGSMQTPQLVDQAAVPDQQQEVVSRLREANRIFNSKKFVIGQPSPKTPVKENKSVEEEIGQKRFAERFLSQSKNEESKTYLGKKKQRIEEITAEQVYNIAADDASPRQTKTDSALRQKTGSDYDRTASSESAETRRQKNHETARSVEMAEEQPAQLSDIAGNDTLGLFQAEVAPFQSVSINDDLVYIFRRVGISNQIYRQGFLIKVQDLVQHLISSHFTGQPLADFTALRIQRRDLPDSVGLKMAGSVTDNPEFVAGRVFPMPFDFIQVSIVAGSMPSSPARGSLNMALGILGLFTLLGFLAIYQSARAIEQMSERRSQFVSSVTHELKTPLTNIRMYIEMLEQGVAATPEREREYLEILGSESARLSSLINNVLELARLEKKQRHFQLQEGVLEDVLPEIEAMMSAKLQREGFRLQIDVDDVQPFHYDPDVLIQILINLVDNSVKFGKHCPQKNIRIVADQTAETVRLAVVDSGPGIPRGALKKIFDDFYRVDNDLTRKTGGTGIGLALVKKFVEAMGGRVQAANNSDAGCTINIYLPRKIS